MRDRCQLSLFQDSLLAHLLLQFHILTRRDNMTDSAAQPTTRSTFPPPPPWWRLYPPELPPQLSTAADRGDTSDAASTTASPPLPTAFGLSIFEPPPSPATYATPYVLFNQSYTASPPPPSLPLNTPQLYESEADDRVHYAKQLSQLADSLLTHWLALLHTLATAQPDTAQLLAALSHTYLNFTHLLARLRRHQAVQHVILLTNDQLTKRRQKRERLEAEVANCKALLARHGMEWEDGDDTVQLRRLENELRGVEEAGLHVEKNVVKEGRESVAQDELSVRRRTDVESDGDDTAAAAEEAEDRQQALQLETLLDSLVDTGDY